MKRNLILAIESSCDETAAAVVEDGCKICSNIVSSQINVHKKYGGVVPEVASRIHVENISVVIEEALVQAEVTMDDILAIAVTQGPGLVGSLHVGVQAAKTLAWYYDKPLIPLHHIIGHIYANRFVDELRFPMIALVVSGGHTELVWMKDEWSFEILGTTQADAIGEAYDKVSRVMGTGYPGGPVIDKMAKQGHPHYTLPKPKTEKPLDFSFSGLKSAVLQLIDRENKKGEELNKEDLSYAFQEAALDTLLKKTMQAVKEFKPKQVVLAGGVAANSRLREKISEMIQETPEVHLTIPPLWCCTDNAAMIGAAGWTAYTHGLNGSLDIAANPSMEIETSSIH